MDIPPPAPPPEPPSPTVEVLAPPPPPPPIPKNLRIKWNTGKNSKYIRFPYEKAYDGLVEQKKSLSYIMLEH